MSLFSMDFDKKALKKKVEPSAEIAILSKQVEDLLEANKKLQENAAKSQTLLSDQNKTMAAAVTANTQSQQKQEEPQWQYEMPKELGDEEMEGLSRNDIEGRTKQLMQAMFERFGTSIQKDLKGVQQISNTQYGNTEYNRLTQKFPDYHEWQPEIQKAITDKVFGPGISADLMYQMVKNMYPEKVEKLKEKYPTDGNTSTSKFGLGGIPSSNEDSGKFVIEGPKEDENADDYAEKTVNDYLDKTGGTLQDVLATERTPGVTIE